jgi:hypothetical protein
LKLERGLTTAEISNPGETALLEYWDATITPRATAVITA